MESVRNEIAGCSVINPQKLKSLFSQILCDNKPGDVEEE
jgi:hypothetical protein